MLIEPECRQGLQRARKLTLEIGADFRHDVEGRSQVVLRQQRDEVLSFDGYTEAGQVCDCVVEVAPLVGVACATLVGRVEVPESGDKVSFPLKLLVYDLVSCEHLGLVCKKILLVLGVRGAFTAEKTVDLAFRNLRAFYNLLRRDFAWQVSKSVSNSRREMGACPNLTASFKPPLLYPLK